MFQSTSCCTMKCRRIRWDHIFYDTKSYGLPALFLTNFLPLVDGRTAETIEMEIVQYNSSDCEEVNLLLLLQKIWLLSYPVLHLFFLDASTPTPLAPPPNFPPTPPHPDVPATLASDWWGRPALTGGGKKLKILNKFQIFQCYLGEAHEATSFQGNQRNSEN